MTKFEEMCEVVKAAQKQWGEFRDRSYRSLNSLVNGFVEYCKIPREQIEFIPLDKEPESGQRYTLIGATHLGEDGYWHLGLVVRILNQRLLIEMCVTEMKGQFLVRAGKEGKARELDFGNQRQTSDFYDEIIDDIKRFFENSPGPTDTSLKDIGFGWRR